MNDWGEGEFRKANGESNRQEVKRILPTNKEEGDSERVSEKSLTCGFDSDGGSAISENSGIRGEQGNLSGQQDTSERFPRNDELGCGNDIIMDDLVDVVSGDLLEIGDESEKKANCKW